MMEDFMAQIENRPVAIQVTGVKKMYKLGQIGGGTLQADLQSWFARKRGKEDPNTKIGEDQRSNGQSFMALNGIDLTIYQGEAVGIIGSNGAGKSTLLKLLSKVTAPTEGEIDIYGRIASMLEVGTGFHGEMTGRENVYMNGAILGMTKAEIDAKMEQIIEFSEVREFIDTPVKRYSSGMFVKLAFSVAAHLDSEIMIMDEVLAVGDMAFQKKCLAKMREAAKQDGRTVLYVSHNMNTIRQLCDRCIVLDKGRVMFEGDVEQSVMKYMGREDSFITEYNVSGLERIAKGYGEIIHINRFVFINKEIPYYIPDENLEFKVCWNSNKILEDLRIRIECYSSDGTVAGMSESRNFAQETSLGENIKSFGFRLKNLANGSYYFRLSFFSLYENGTHLGLDDIKNIKFIISENEKNKTKWARQYWGSVRFDNIFIID